MTDAPGTFYCPLCQQSYPETIQEQHEAAHDLSTIADPEEGWRASDGIFWTACVAIGAIAGLLVTSL